MHCLFDSKEDIEEFLNTVNSKYPVKKGNTTTQFCDLKDIKVRKDGKYFCPKPPNDRIESKFKNKFTEEKYQENWVDKEIEIFQEIPENLKKELK